MEHSINPWLTQALLVCLVLYLAPSLPSETVERNQLELFNARNLYYSQSGSWEKVPADPSLGPPCIAGVFIRHWVKLDISWETEKRQIRSKEDDSKQEGPYKWGLGVPDTWAVGMWGRNRVVNKSSFVPHWGETIWGDDSQVACGWLWVLTDQGLDTQG